MVAAFYGKLSPRQLIEKYGSPLYVYNESILRTRCREMTSLLSWPGFKVNYSTKANSNLDLLKIIHSEGLAADAMSPGEIHLLMAAGFPVDQIFYVGNNVSASEMQFAIDRGIMVSADSLSQLEMFGRLNPGGQVAVRFNPGVGAGHHQKVVTGGTKTKFGVERDALPRLKEILEEYHLRLVGINQHIGSLFLDGEVYLEGVKAMLEFAENFSELIFIDLGGGFGIPYRKAAGEARLNLQGLGVKLGEVLENWLKGQRREIEFWIEPGRYVTAEAGRLLGTVHAVKTNYGQVYAGTDLGFNVLTRPVIYDAYHELNLYREDELVITGAPEPVTVVGNICESGDIIARNRDLPPVREGDLLEVMDAGAYGFAMSSNYNCRLRPAEVLITATGEARLIRRRETLADLLVCFNLQ